MGKLNNIKTPTAGRSPAQAASSSNMLVKAAKKLKRDARVVSPPRVGGVGIALDLMLRQPVSLSVRFAIPETPIMGRGTVRRLSLSKTRDEPGPQRTGFMLWPGADLAARTNPGLFPQDEPDQPLDGPLPRPAQSRTRSASGIGS
jgi:hypothetical protein